MAVSAGSSYGLNESNIRFIYSINKVQDSTIPGPFPLTIRAVTGRI